MAEKFKIQVPISVAQSVSTETVQKWRDRTQGAQAEIIRKFLNVVADEMGRDKLVDEAVGQFGGLFSREQVINPAFEALDGKTADEIIEAFGVNMERRMLAMAENFETAVDSQEFLDAVAEATGDWADGAAPGLGLTGDGENNTLDAPVQIVADAGAGEPFEAPSGVKVSGTLFDIDHLLVDGSTFKAIFTSALIAAGVQHLRGESIASANSRLNDRLEAVLDPATTDPGASNLAVQDNPTEGHPEYRLRINT